MVSLVFFVDILQLPHTVISNSEKLTHPIVQCIVGWDYSKTVILTMLPPTDILWNYSNCPCPSHLGSKFKELGETYFTYCTV